MVPAVPRVVPSEPERLPVVAECAHFAAAALTDGSCVSGCADFIRAGLQYLASAFCSAAGPAPFTVRATLAVSRPVLLTAPLGLTLALVVAPVAPAVPEVASVALTTSVATSPPNS